MDLRIYTCKPGRVDDFVAIYKEKAWPLQQKYLGRCLGWYTTREGRLNTVVHLWGYDSQADREARRAAMAADPAFKAYLDAVAAADVLVEMENRLVTPTSFSPVQ
ncbi:MAG TPA: NIPSNAP family protein [Beijerinckiaceae bacterium]|nr:NIPSNAP family protein [Beijerinckiaceae bacterium]